MGEEKEGKHLVLVHGACHGAWSWYKVKPRLEREGHRVTVLDLAASGINPKTIQDVHTFHEYSEPLLKVLSGFSEKVVLVGHSLGGMNLALAAEMFPEKVSVAVYVTAFLPDTKHYPGYVLDQLVKRMPKEAWLDTEFAPYGSHGQSLSMLFGPKFISAKLYQLSPVEDFELAKALVRPSSLFTSDLSKAKKFSEERYGSVKRVYIICKEDQAITEELQRFMIENGGVEEVMEMEGSDHMPMFSKPQELCNCLSEIANKYT